MEKAGSVMTQRARSRNGEAIQMSRRHIHILHQLHQDSRLGVGTLKKAKSTTFNEVMKTLSHMSNGPCTRRRTSKVVTTNKKFRGVVLFVKVKIVIL